MMENEPETPSYGWDASRCLYYGDSWEKYDELILKAETLWHSIMPDTSMEDVSLITKNMLVLKDAAKAMERRLCLNNVEKV